MPGRGARRGRGGAWRHPAVGPADRADHARVILFHRPGPRARQAHRDRSSERPGGAQGRGARRSHPGQPPARRAGEAPRGTGFAARMKATYFSRFGGPEVLQYGVLPDPVPASGEVVVDIHAASVNAADWKMRAGQYSHGIPLPHVPGRDFSGVVAALGEAAKDFKLGDAVFGVCEVPREGAYAEKIAIRQEILARKPGSLTHAQCASIGLAGLTALVSIEDTLKLKAGETILIHGGAGGVGGFAIALARHLRARVVTTAIAALVVQGVVPLPAIVEYPLAEAAAAHRVSELRHLRGKLVLRVR